MIANGEMRRLLLAFLQGWSTSPNATDFRDVRLDLRLGRQADELCRRIAANLCISLNKEPPSVAAILLIRIVTAIEISYDLSPRAMVMDGPPAEDDQEALSIIFDVLLPALELDPKLDGGCMEAVWVGFRPTVH